MESLLKKTAIWASIAAAIYLMLFFFVDRAVDLWIHVNWSGTWIYNWGTYISYLATGTYIEIGIAFCFILVIIRDPGFEKRWTRLLLYICISAAVAIIIGAAVKYLLGRYRPVMLFEQGLYGLHFLSTEWELNSSPSGHTLRSFSVLTSLSMLYRRFAYLFIAIAVLIGLSRIIVTAHYPSDVVFGAFIGVFSALWVYKYFFIKDKIS